MGKENFSAKDFIDDDRKPWDGRDRRHVTSDGGRGDMTGLTNRILREGEYEGKRGSDGRLKKVVVTANRYRKESPGRDGKPHTVQGDSDLLIRSAVNRVKFEVMTNELDPRPRTEEDLKSVQLDLGNRDRVYVVNRRQAVNLGTEGLGLRIKKALANGDLTPEELGMTTAGIDLSREDVPEDSIVRIRKLPAGFTRATDSPGTIRGGIDWANKFINRERKTISGIALGLENHLAKMPKVKAIRDVLGHNALQFSASIEQQRQLSHRSVDERLSTEYLDFMSDEFLQLVEILHEDMFNPARAAKVKEAYMSVFADELEGFDQESGDVCKFVQELYRVLGRHITVQLMDRDDALKIDFPDLQRTLGIVLGKAPKKHGHVLGKDHDERFGPSVLITDRIPLGGCRNIEEAQEVIDKLSNLSGTQYQVLGVETALDMAIGDTLYGGKATIDEDAKVSPWKRIETTDEQDVIVRYEYPGNFKDRSLEIRNFHSEDGGNPLAAISFGVKFPLPVKIITK
ncbi:hypothetical protein KJ632_00465 [Patescibacteria group bacterium]|nr:hypothetical protein [Patescibacteria group bacterium]